MNLATVERKDEEFHKGVGFLGLVALDPCDGARQCFMAAPSRLYNFQTCWTCCSQVVWCALGQLVPSLDIYPPEQGFVRGVGLAGFGC